jgi:hypothetical protein
VLNDLEGRPAAAHAARRVAAPSLRRMAWPALWTAAAVVLFLLAWHEARQMSVQSDGASISLQAWQMLHGNVLLHGWHIADVSFYTTEIPLYMLVEAVHGLHPDVVAICAAINYTLLVAGAAFLAWGRAGGREGLVRALLAAGIMLAPSAAAATWLLNDPDHAATALWVLLALVIIDRCGQRWYVPVLVGALLAWAAVGDPLIEVIGAAPVALVCLIRVGQGLVQRREPLRSRWYELSLAAAAVVAVALAAAATHLIKAAGGWVVSKGVAEFVPSSRLPANLAVTFEDFFGLFSADFFGAKIGTGLVPIVIHLAGACLVALALWLAIRGLLRSADLVAAILAVSVACGLASYTLLFIGTPSDIREVSPAFALGAALAGRVLGAPLVRNRLEPLLAAGLACYLLTLGPAITVHARPPANSALANWLEDHHLNSGISGYWQANSVVLDSGTSVIMRTVKAEGGTLVPYPWELDTRLLDPSRNNVNFVVAMAGGVHGLTEAQAVATFGKPAHVYSYQQYRIMVWNKNLLALLPPLPPGP